RHGDVTVTPQIRVAARGWLRLRRRGHSRSAAAWVSGSRLSADADTRAISRPSPVAPVWKAYTPVSSSGAIIRGLPSLLRCYSHPHTQWWPCPHSAAVDVRFLSGRLTFGGPTNPAPPLKSAYPAQPKHHEQRGARFGDGGPPLAVLALVIPVLALVIPVLALAVLSQRWQHRRRQQTEPHQTRCKDPTHHHRLLSA